MDKRLLDQSLSIALNQDDNESKLTQNARDVRSKLIEMNKMQGRDHSPHRLSMGFLNKRSDCPNEHRFDNINKSPEVLSTVKHVKSPSLSGYSPRKNLNPIPNCASICYDINLDAVKPSPAKPVLDFQKVTARQNRVKDSCF